MFGRAPDIRLAALVLLRAVALLLALLTGRRAYHIMYDNAFEFDGAFGWYGVSLLLLIAASANRALLSIFGWPARAANYSRVHVAEIAAVVVILAMAVFVRVGTYGTMPPSDFLCCEEAINAGVATDVLDGARPLNYPTVRYSTAAGLDLIGKNTNGLRLPFIIWAIAAIIPFYLLMRQLTSAFGSAFATALFASNHSLGDVSIGNQTGIFEGVFLALALVRALKTGNPLWWLAGGLTAAAMSYEYESFKIVPLAFAVFLAAAAGWSLAWPLSSSPRTWGTRVWSLVRRHWYGGLICLVALVIALSPMIAREHHNDHIYLGSLRRNEVGRTSSGWQQSLSPRWRDQVHWVTQIYRPWVAPDYPATGSVDADGIIDTPAALLIWLGTIAALVGFWRPWRLLFLGWFAGGSLFLGLMVANFAPWKAVGFVPPGLVLAGLLADDAWNWLGGRRKSVTAALVAAAIVVAGLAFAKNVSILRANRNDPGVLNSYNIGDSQVYATCHHLKDRPADNFNYLAEWAIGPGAGFAAPRTDYRSERAAWQNHYAFCGGLQGVAAAAGEEVWPPWPANGKTATITVAASDGLIDSWTSSIERLMPGISPNFRLMGPNSGLDRAARKGLPEGFQIVMYDFSGLEAWRGLWRKDGDLPADRRVVDPEALTADQGELRLRAVVFVGESGVSGQSLVMTGADGEITIDGKPSFASVDGVATETSLSLSEGWHVLDALVRPRVDERVALEWHGPGGPFPVSRDQFFALPVDRGWTHTRTFGDTSGPTKTLTRFDLQPHIGREDLTHPPASEPAPATGWKFFDDVWSGVWHVDQSAAYDFEVTSISSDVALTIAGQAMTPTRVERAPDGSYVRSTYRIEARPGDAEVEIRFRLTGTTIVGGTLLVKDAAGAPVSPVISPY